MRQKMADMQMEQMKMQMQANMNLNLASQNQAQAAAPIVINNNIYIPAARLPATLEVVAAALTASTPAALRPVSLPGPGSASQHRVAHRGVAQILFLALFHFSLEEPWRLLTADCVGRSFCNFARSSRSLRSRVASTR